MKVTGDLIANGELLVVGRLVDATNASLLAQIKDCDPQIKVVYKPVAGERPLWDFPDGSLAHREYAAFRLSDIGNFNLVPFTVLREGPFGFGMVQEWVEIDENVDVVDYGQGEDVQLRKMALFDAIINNTDRKFGHLLVDKSGSLKGCDHGVCFHSEDKLRTVIWQFAGEQFTKEEFDLLKTLEELDLESLFSPYLTLQEIAALKDRIKGLKIAGKFPLPRAQWPAVPWPPV